METRHRYTLYGEIASGGMAVVRLGRQEGPHGLSRIVAIKKLHTRCADDQELISMFRDEVRVAARVIHPNVVPMLDVVAVHGELLLVMEYVHGESVARLAKLAHVAMPPEIASTIMVGALHGLHAAHEARSESGQPLRIIHRDVTPQNMVVGVDGLPRLLDFGIAHAVGRLQTTRFGQIKGKLAYMAPEQLVAEALDRRVDVYSAAVTLWEMLAGRKLFDGNKQEKVARMVLTRPVERPGLFQRGIPPELDAIVLRGLQREPQRRFSTAREMAIALEQQTQTVSATELGDWVRRVWGEGLTAREEQILEIESSEATGYVFRPSADERAEEIARAGELSTRLQEQSSSAGTSSVGSDLRFAREGPEANTGTCATVPALPGRWSSGLSRDSGSMAEASVHVDLPQRDHQSPRVRLPTPYGAYYGAFARNEDQEKTPRLPLAISWSHLKPAVPLAAAFALSLMMAIFPVSGGRDPVLTQHGSPAAEAQPPFSVPVKPVVTMLPALVPVPAPPDQAHASAALDTAASGGSIPKRLSPDTGVLKRSNHKRRTSAEPRRSSPQDLFPDAVADLSRSQQSRALRYERALARAASARADLARAEEPATPLPERLPPSTPPVPHSAHQTPAAPVAAAARLDCQPPYVTDAAGIKHFKVSCL